MDSDIEHMQAAQAVRGRGTGELPKGRFERVEAVFEPQPAGQVATEIYKDTSRSILSVNDSPDVGFSMSLNPYRGCEHGCVYCYARPTHEYLGLSAGLDFETKLFAKMEAPALLRAELAKPSWKPQIIGISGITDCYQPAERKLELTRGCLRVLAKCANPVVVITKNHLVTRDIDLLAELAAMQAVMVVLSVTTLNSDLARKLEPRASTPGLRLKAIEELSKAGIPVAVNMAPVIPGLTDHEIPQLLAAAASAGASNAHYVMLRLPYGVKDLFASWLEQHAPMRKGKVLNRLRTMRGGKLYDSSFTSRMRGEGIFAEQVALLFTQSRKRYGLDKAWPPLETKHFRKPQGAQLSLL